MIVHTTIATLPIADFDVIQKSGDKSPLAKIWLPKWVLGWIWKRIMDQYIKEIGIGAEYAQYLKAMRSYVKMLGKSFDRRSYLINAMHYKQVAGGIAERMDKQAGTDIYKLCAELSKHQGYRIDPKNTPVREFYALLKATEERIKSQKNG